MRCDHMQRPAEKVKHTPGAAGDHAVRSVGVGSQTAELQLLRDVPFYPEKKIMGQ
jgi:hypothetical protein